MMTSFDTDAPLFQAVRKLASVRKNNISVQFGSQWPRYLTPDVYCLSRHYGESRCFVALNRGDSITLDRVLTDLPDGLHTCVLTGKSISIVNGEAKGLELGGGQALVFAFDAVPVSGRAVTLFQLNGCPTQPGEGVAVVGSCPELGSWDESRAFPLEYINANTWQGGLALDESAGKQITYKYMLIRENAGSDPPVRENRTTRRRVVPDSGTAKWRDIWEE